MIYALLRSFVSFCLAIFYREIAVTGTPDPGGPTIFVANHPNTLMDALLIATRLERPLSIIAKGSLFANPLAAFILRSLGVLPVMRREYEASQGAEQGANDDTFQAIYEALRDGRAVLIFGEGTSHNEPHLLRLKTGAARMALGAEERFGPLGVTLVPVGLTYEAPELFGERVRIRFSDPLPALPFLERAGDPREAARQLTEHVRACLVDEVVHLTDPEHADLLVAVDRWIGRRFITDERHRLDVLLEIAKALNHVAAEDPARVERFREALRGYEAQLEAQGLTDDALVEQPPISAGQWAFAALVAPVWFYGALNHLIPYRIPRLAAGLLRLDPVYTSTVKLVTGIFAFASCYALQTWLVARFAGWELALGYLLTLPSSGMIALSLLHKWEALKERRRLRRLRERAAPEVLAELRARREALVAELEAAERELLANDSASPSEPEDGGL